MAEGKGRLHIVGRGQKSGHDYVIFERDGGYFGIIFRQEVEMMESLEKVEEWLEDQCRDTHEFAVGLVGGFVPRMKGTLVGKNGTPRVECGVDE